MTEIRVPPVRVLAAQPGRDLLQSPLQLELGLHTSARGTPDPADDLTIERRVTGTSLIRVEQRGPDGGLWLGIVVRSRSG